MAAKACSKTFLTKQRPWVGQSFLLTKSTPFALIQVGIMSKIEKKLKQNDSSYALVENTKSSQGSGTCSYLRSLIDSVTSTRAFSLVLVGSTSRIEMIDPSMRRSGW